MDNLFALAWNRSFVLIIMAIVILFCYVFALRKKKSKYNWLYILAIVFGFIYGGYLSIPYMQDYIENDFHIIQGTVEEEYVSKHMSTGTVYEYTILQEDGNRSVLFVSGDVIPEMEMELDHRYAILYYPRTRAIHSFSLIE